MSEQETVCGDENLIRNNISKTTTIKYPEWQPEVEAAKLEGDPQTLRQRVDAAEAAIFLRSQSLVGRAEKRAMAEAIQSLRVIQKEKLGYPDWNNSGLK
jgi:hypothetical protein